MHHRAASRRRRGARSGTGARSPASSGRTCVSPSPIRDESTAERIDHAAIRQDLAYALRIACASGRHSPSLAVLMLALGIGANVAIFSLRQRADAETAARSASPTG